MKIKETKAFKKDARKAFKRGKDIDKLFEVVYKLSQEEKLPDKYQDHPLKGDWAGSRDCHIEPDWLLIYRYEDEYLILERTGSHSDLFE
jgi:mRNA interferase YafQ